MVNLYGSWIGKLIVSWAEGLPLGMLRGRRTVPGLLMTTLTLTLTDPHDAKPDPNRHSRRQ